MPLDTRERRPGWETGTPQEPDEKLKVTLTDPTEWCAYPDHHAARLAAAGLEPSCLDHGCPLCVVSGLIGRGESLSCWDCVKVDLAVVDAEWPEATRDPWCMFHRVPDLALAGTCEVCDEAVAEARRMGWTGPTGHIGHHDCLHCVVCGECEGTGRVCRHCWRCVDHSGEPPRGSSADCEYFRWDRFVRDERPYYVHSYRVAPAGRWSP